MPTTTGLRALLVQTYMCSCFPLRDVLLTFVCFLSIRMFGVVLFFVFKVEGLFWLFRKPNFSKSFSNFYPRIWYPEIIFFTKDSLAYSFFRFPSFCSSTHLRFFFIHLTHCLNISSSADSFFTSSLFFQ